MIILNPHHLWGINKMSNNSYTYKDPPVKNIKDLVLNEVIFKSNYKYKCSVCDNDIKRGQYVTRVAECVGMRLKPVYTNCRNYIKHCGSSIVHWNCCPENTWTLYKAEEYTKNNFNEDYLYI